MSSYVPLFVLLAIRFDGIALRVACLLIALVGTLFARSLVRAQESEEPQPMYVAEARNEGAQVAAHLATYLLPFLTVSEPDVQDIVAYCVFLVMVGFVFITTDFLQVNPLLALDGFHLFHVRNSQWQGFVLSRDPVDSDANYLVVDVVNTSVRRVIRKLEGAGSDGHS
ncbi:hypothetical protein AB6N24_14965 [Cellulomonas sp. 179-A 4D5 NHS]|uniref:hypothetical protein n=1 Tax=Cellulomonas sp. 179-A 4D5 NHS TaxID=3142378 RepID=UPI0039A1F3CA